MKLSRRLAPLALLALPATIAVLLMPAGCKDDEPTKPQEKPVLASMWLNEDGRFWSFDATVRQWGTGFETDFSPVSIPLPSLSELAALAAEREYPEPATVSTGTFRLQFTDSLTTGSGVRRQNLVESLTFDPAVLATASQTGSTFLRQLAIARPDLRSRIAARTGSGPSLAGGVQSLILHGGAWEKTADWIGGYGDLNQQLAWKYLDSDLSTGHEFVLQLVPDLASDVYLRARVLGPIRVETPSGVYLRAIEVFYVIDYGESQATDESGNPLGYSHSVGYGSIAFAPGVGPVASYERPLATWGPNGLGAGNGELQFRLRSSGLTS